MSENTHEELNLRLVEPKGNKPQYRFVIEAESNLAGLWVEVASFGYKPFAQQFLKAHNLHSDLLKIAKQSRELCRRRLDKEPKPKILRSIIAWHDDVIAKAESKQTN